MGRVLQERVREAEVARGGEGVVNEMRADRHSLWPLADWAPGLQALPGPRGLELILSVMHGRGRWLPPRKPRRAAARGPSPLPRAPTGSQGRTHACECFRCLRLHMCKSRICCRDGLQGVCANSPAAGITRYCRTGVSPQAGEAREFPGKNQVSRSALPSRDTLKHSDATLLNASRFQIL